MLPRMALFERTTPMHDSNPLCERNMVDSNRRVRHRMRRFGSVRRPVGINMEEGSNCAPSPARRGGMGLAVCPSVYLLLLMMLPLALEEAGITLELTSYTLQFLYLERERLHTLQHATSCID